MDRTNNCVSEITFTQAEINQNHVFHPNVPLKAKSLWMSEILLFWHKAFYCMYSKETTFECLFETISRLRGNLENKEPEVTASRKQISLKALLNLK